MMGMLVFKFSSAYERCRRRLRKDDFGMKLWGYLCAALFLIAVTISMLGCAGTQLTPRLTRGAGSPGGDAFAGSSIGSSAGNPIATLTVNF